MDRAERTGQREAMSSVITTSGAEADGPAVDPSEGSPQLARSAAQNPAIADRAVHLRREDRVGLVAFTA